MSTRIEHPEAELQPRQQAQAFSFSRIERDSLVNAAGVVISGLAGLVLVPILMKHWGANPYGVWIAAFALAQMASLFNFGLGRTVIRFVAAADAEQRLRILGAAFTSYLLLSCISAALVFLGGLLLAAPLGLAVGESSTARNVFFVFAVTLPIQSLFVFATDALAGGRYFPTANALSTGFTIIRAAALIVTALVGKGILVGSVIAMMVTSAAALVGLALVRHHFKGLRPSGIRAAIRELRKELRFTIHSQLVDSANVVLWESAPLILSVLVGPALTAYYYVGARFPIALASVSSKAAETALPAASEHSGDLEGLRRVLIGGTRSVLALTIPVSFALYYFAPYLLHSWLRTDNAQAVAVLRLMSLAVGVEGLGATAMHVLWGRTETKKLFYFTLAAALLNVALTFLLVPVLGMEGSAVAFLVAISFATAAYTLLSLHLCSLKTVSFIKPIVRSIGLPSVVMFAVCWAMLHRGIEYGLPIWFGSAAVVCGSFWLTWLAMEFLNRRRVLHV